MLGDSSVFKVNYRRFSNYNIIFREILFSQIFSSSEKALVVSHFFQTKYRWLWPKGASYIRDIGGFVSYTGFIGNIGALAGLNRVFRFIPNISSHFSYYALLFCL